MMTNMMMMNKLQFVYHVCANEQAIKVRNKLFTRYASMLFQPSINKVFKGCAFEIL